MNRTGVVFTRAYYWNSPFPIAGIAPIAAYAAGGAVGAITSVLLNGGLGSITGFLGGQQAAVPSVGTTEFGV